MGVPTTERYTSSAEMWDWLNIGSAGQTRDATAMAGAIIAAEIAIDTWCDRRFDNEGETAARYFRPLSARFVEIDDCIDLSTVKCTTGTQSSGTFTAFAGDYVTWTCNGGSIYRLEAETVGWGAWVEIVPTTSWGWTAVPEPISEMARRIAGRLYKGKDAPEGLAGFDGAGVVRVDVGLSRLEKQVLRPWRRQASP